jgi:hypothetical protein
VRRRRFLFVVTWLSPVVLLNTVLSAFILVRTPRGMMESRLPHIAVYDPEEPGSTGSPTLPTPLARLA